MKSSRITYVFMAMLAGMFLFVFSGCSVGLPDTGTPVSTAGQKLKVYFLDVGQGASQLLVTPSGKTMLIDAGNNDKEQVMLDYMKQYHISKLDVVIGTHPDADHIGGLDKVIDQIPVETIYMPKVQSNTKTFESVLKSIKNKGLKVKTAKAGLSWDLDDEVHVDMLAPTRSYDDSNNMSAVVKVTYGQTSFLLTGDAESASEKDMIASGADLQADVLLVGHHGSNSSTTLSFLKKVNPKYAVIQVGKGNTYGHPKSAILSRLQKQGVEVFRNDRQGTVEVDSDGSSIQISTER
ncbi:ComEC/Rec2 family competence protein [Paenibacillus sp. JTLBN-2024]|uniref:MBL fold hydrolase n=1 Tax=Paenibacillus cookii TaxID=157839 RepID=A0ABQ4LPX8_9BACL|nr:ComEC/Rec2 family competence protein [Paenibacillus cookii]GIO65324.1 MBL fold hydrolase [Paenibacillus cookii]HWO53056.1 ComEC/Rec2 family competence protein [Paenibacillus cookii]